ncbi:chymotrypsin-2-like [Phymastichus coffea]|uniref:chymotrypsin-2-like n=1 Tax=Phymastichus coffea TaxID=108790 RepID=UPI00273AC9E3|nr:chymotrypsin-2-like [Phymastichus coffea]
MFNTNLLLFVLKLATCLTLIASKAVASGENDFIDRIFQGEYDTHNEHRYHVAILQINPNDTTELICGGAIVDSHYVLTAAHCVYGQEKNNLLIRSGWNKNPEKPELEKRIYHKVARIMYPKDYFHSECRSHEHDIAIIKVQRAFDLVDDKNFYKVNLPEYDNDYENYEATLTGFGVEKISIYVNKTSDTASKELKYSQELKYLDTKVIPIEECKLVSPVIVTNGNICTQSQNINGFSCIGDSGGPLVHEGVIIGIRNSHNNQCNHNQPEMFTRVSAYLNFINNVLNQQPSAGISYN